MQLIPIWQQKGRNCVQSSTALVSVKDTNVCVPLAGISNEVPRLSLHQAMDSAKNNDTKGKLFGLNAGKWVVMFKSQPPLMRVQH